MNYTKKEFESNCAILIQIVKSFSKLCAAGGQTQRMPAPVNLSRQGKRVDAARKPAGNNLVKIADVEVNYETDIVSPQNSRTLFCSGIGARQNLIAF